MNLMNESKFSDMIEKNSWTKDQAMEPANFNQLKKILKRSVSDTIKTVDSYFQKNQQQSWTDDDPIVVNKPDCNFADEKYLNGVVAEWHPFCSLSPNRAVQDISQITTAVCGAKFSKLCGFMFKSSVNSENPFFWIIYAPKKAKYTNKGHRANMSEWHCWKMIGKTNNIIMDDDSMFTEYQFDLAAFLTCDVMKKYIPMFAAQVKNALATTVERFLHDMPAKGYTQDQIKDARFSVECLKTSVQKLEQEQTARIDDHQYRLKAWKGYEVSDMT